MERRIFLKQSGLFLLTSSALPLVLRQAAFGLTLNSSERKTLVVIFQRGAADGLSMVPPLGDSGYGKHIRPSIALTSSEALKLDGYFGLHPALKDFMPLWNNKQLAVIHQVGSPNATRSHFDAQDYMETGVPGVKSVEDGFLDRILLELPDSEKKSIFKGIAMQPSLPRAMWGNSGAFAMNAISEFSKGGGSTMSGSGSSKGFEYLYDQALDQALRGAGQNTFQAMGALQKLPGNSSDANYPRGKLSAHLADIARLIKGDVGLRVAMTDCGGWDTHQRQGGAKGQLARNLEEFGGSIAAFTKDLGKKMDDVCIVTMTEFGRTVKENGNGGTDHGHASVMFLMGNMVQGRQVRTKWKNLTEENLYEGRDLPVTTDFRDVWTEIFASHFQVANASKVFPDFKSSTKMVGLFG